MAQEMKPRELSAEELKWRLDPDTLPFETTEQVEPLQGVIGQDRALEAFRFGVEIEKGGYNIFVTGLSGSNRMKVLERMIRDLVKKHAIPDDLCYVNNFQKPEEPKLIRLPAGLGREFKEDVDHLIEGLKTSVPQLFESEDYLNMKKDILEKYEEQGKKFFKEIGNRVKEEGFAMVEIQMGQLKRPMVMPIIDEKPVHIDQLEAMVEAGNFPREKFERIKRKQAELTDQIDRVFLEMRDMDRDVRKKLEEMDRYVFLKSVSEPINELKVKFKSDKVQEYIDAMIQDMADHLDIFKPKTQQQMMMPFGMTVEQDQYQPYRVNLFIDNAECSQPPIIVENFPTFRNLFGSIERVVDRTGLWRTDYSRMKAGSFIQANGGYLVLDLMDAVVEPGVWQSLKRALKASKYEVQSYDPFFLFTTSGLKPEPIDIEVKVVMVGDLRSYHILLTYDPDMKNIFKVRADFDSVMKREDKSIDEYVRLIRGKLEENRLRHVDRTGVAALLEHSVRMAGRREKLSAEFDDLTGILEEADVWAARDNSPIILGKHVDGALEGRIYRGNMIEEKLQELVTRGTLLIDTDGAVVGQVNGLSVYDMGDYAFAKPARITATTSMGRAGIINIEREADLSGSTHNKGVLILSGYLRNQYAQDKPLTMSASLAFEQSYGGVDGDSASSTEIYALLSSLAGVPIRQDLAVTGSVNQHGDIQPIGGVNWKIEGFYQCCKAKGLTGKQGVLIPSRNIEDLQLRDEVVQAVKDKKFSIYPVNNIDEGIEVLTGLPAGKRDKDGKFPEGSVNCLVDRKLLNLAEGLAAFGKEEETKPDKERKGKPGRPKSRK